MDPSMTWLETLIVTVAGALVGGGLTGFFTLRAADKSHRQALDLQKQHQQKIVKGFLQAVHDEIETLWEAYQSGVGVQLEALQDGNALLVYYPVTQEYFTVYNSNGFLIGHVEDADLRKMIVQVYSAARGLIDSYKMNNEMLSKLEFWMYLYKETSNSVYEQNAQEKLAAMQLYAKSMKSSHAGLKDISSQLLRRLRKMGVIADSVNTS
ncbi:MAG: hypothetical protein R8K46_03740 [Mariprofundaceae bacterium]